ncbi:MAG TPA: hypothetical protein DCS26_06145 [Porticoccaceae bacterium]|nr:hypothetical protein [Porticoccaceae bacterium]
MPIPSVSGHGIRSFPLLFSLSGVEFG